MKTCSDCKQEKEVGAYSKDRYNPDGLRYWCRECAAVRWQKYYLAKPDHFRAKSKEWGKANPEKKRLVFKRCYLKSRYGLTLEQYEEMWKSQDGKCLICQDLLKHGRGKGSAHIDHCHESGKIRGLLCQDCNIGLGHLHTIERLFSAAEYLKKHS